jgi:hypothetical protein
MDEIELIDPFAGFEGLFQRFMNGEFIHEHAIDEDWHRYYAALRQKKDPNVCQHGKTKLTCPDCYFGT